ncbi:tRNA(His) guanylyltransferase Thg1 family protein [Endozoicomonas numazuensis]|uniref:tRNAHis guanylyltransferase catalytic domain-containing protein n=1 Tax=Endozoicomonas numazuensis TaxID=1137799 RepID=A0A081NGI5_9GAMM|nr:tRNA(His) guanylyltransferase Thg1 family protein [Endozoicomonas numazuensis]KEQ11354.1 hypothetical protein GZ78_29045 [Endozoicomonas numazuensis]KEQ17558.1 hypothetical protein GZ78_17595 [Endozoicomonas numazuensis]
MKEVKLLEKYCEYEEHFRIIEEKSEVVSKVSEDEYLCIRLDGIGLSKKYLKDSIKDNRFTGLMWEALESTYNVLHRKAPTDAQNIFLCAIICSDEVSIILNSQTNYFEGRLFKIVTTIASTFSSFFTGGGFSAKRKKTEQRIGGSFDGRPLILSNTNEVSDYLAYRFATYIRNKNSKLLRIEGISSDELYSDKNYNNISFYESMIKELKLQEKSDVIPNEPIIFIPDSSGKLTNYRYESLNEFLENTPQKISEFDAWVRAKCA